MSHYLYWPLLRTAVRAICLQMVVCATILVGCQTHQSNASAQELSETARTFERLLSRDFRVVDEAFRKIRDEWQPGFAAMLVDATRVSRNPDVYRNTLAILERKSGQKFPDGLTGVEKWIWKNEPQTHPDYIALKSALYSRIDPRFHEYFLKTDDAKIQLNEIVWGGVLRDGIPPLKNPEMIAPGQATYLNDTDIVFGVVLNGDARCYPKRILAWHEMFKDTIGGESVCGAY